MHIRICVYVDACMCIHTYDYACQELSGEASYCMHTHPHTSKKHLEV